MCDKRDLEDHTRRASNPHEAKRAIKRKCAFARVREVGFDRLEVEDGGRRYELERKPFGGFRVREKW